MFERCIISHIHKNKARDFHLWEAAKAQDKNHHLEIFPISGHSFVLKKKKKGTLMSTFVLMSDFVICKRPTAPNSSCLFLYSCYTEFSISLFWGGWGLLCFSKSMAACILLFLNWSTEMYGPGPLIAERVSALTLRGIRWNSEDRLLKPAMLDDINLQAVVDVRHDVKHLLSCLIVSWK